MNRYSEDFWNNQLRLLYEEGREYERMTVLLATEVDRVLDSGDKARDVIPLPVVYRYNRRQTRHASVPMTAASLVWLALLGMGLIGGSVIHDASCRSHSAVWMPGPEWNQRVNR